MSKPLQLIGRQDFIHLPEFGLKGVAAKVDTGAYTSSINCSKVKLTKVDGVPTLNFQLSGNKIHEKKARKFSTTTFKKKKIRSSNGVTEERYIIKTSVVIMKRRFNTEFSLSDRSKMKFPVLLGRKVLTNRFIVDVSQKDISLKLTSKNIKADSAE
ncbi:ATP-dependent zinc protease [Roseivirga sp.]|uniref:ATP-dependent zinc protease family protein n=1 Tax=Roseivirga sp. TaxID=1964215 RepID=UPI002B272725|nr:RimK/LysX family protein [Roseivirga sp.]